jgi:cell division protein FtsZ
LIATGFTEANMFSNMQDEEITKLLKSLKVEDELDIPSFMRRPLFNQRSTPSITPQTIKTEAKAQNINMANK